MKQKTVVIHQPDFIPYLGFFHRFLQADEYIVLDHVQFPPRNWTHRDKIKTARGEEWLTLSTKKTPRDTPINQVELSTDVDWAKDHLNILHENYRSTPFFAEIMPHVQTLYANPPRLLAEFNMQSIQMILNLLDITIPTVFSSAMSPQGNRNALLVDLLKKTGATHYLCGSGSRDYLDVPAFETAGIQVVWQNFTHPAYPQPFGEFIPFLSTLDALFNCGTEQTQKMLRSQI